MYKSVAIMSRKYYKKLVESVIGTEDADASIELLDTLKDQKSLSPSGMANQMMSSTSYDHKLLFIWLAGRVTKKPTTRALIQIAHDKTVDEVFRIQSLVSLRNIGERSLLPELIKIAENKHNSLEVRLHAILALGEIPTRHAAHTLKRFLSNEVLAPRLRGGAAEAIGNSRYGKLVLNDLRRQVNHSEHELRFWIIYAIGQIGDLQDITVLKAIADSDGCIVLPWGSISKEAQDAIAAIEKRNY